MCQNTMHEQNRKCKTHYSGILQLFDTLLTPPPARDTKGPTGTWCKHGYEYQPPGISMISLSLFGMLCEQPNQSKPWHHNSLIQQLPNCWSQPFQGPQLSGATAWQNKYKRQINYQFVGCRQYWLMPHVGYTVKQVNFPGNSIQGIFAEGPHSQNWIAVKLTILQ